MIRQSSRPISHAHRPTTTIHVVKRVVSCCVGKRGERMIVRVIESSTSIQHNSISSLHYIFRKTYIFIPIRIYERHSLGLTSVRYVENILSWLKRPTHTRYKTPEWRGSFDQKWAVVLVQQKQWLVPSSV